MKRKAAMIAIAMAMTVSTAFAGPASTLVAHAEEAANVETQSEDNGDGSGDSGNSDSGSSDSGSTDSGSSSSGSTDSGSSSSGSTDSGSGSSGSTDSGSGSSGSTDSGSGSSGSTDSESGSSGSTDSGSGNSGSNGSSGSGSNNSGNTGSKDEDEDIIGSILDDLFGANKPKPDPGAEGTTGGGMTEEEAHESEIRGNRPSGYIDESGNYYKYHYNEDGSWYLEGLGISGTGTPTIEEIEAGLKGGSGNTGSTGGSTISVNPVAPGTSVTQTNKDGSVTTLVGNADGTVTVTTVKLDGTVSTVTMPGSSFVAPGVLPTGVTTFVPVTDEATLAAFPEAMIVTAPSGIPFIHALNPERTIYSVWSDGYQVDAFMIQDANNAFVPIQAATIVVTAENKAYVNVTIPENVKGAKVFAAQEQKVGFVKLFGINGVMINGELAEEFVIPDSVIPEAN